METVSVKLVIFKEGDKYCGYCPELTLYVNNRTSENIIIDITREHLYQELCHRIRYVNLKNRGWKVSENSAIPPIFANEEAISLTEQLYEAKIVEPKVIEVNVGLPDAKNLW